jgi:hypothetical protein
LVHCAREKCWFSFSNFYSPGFGLSSFREATIIPIFLG